MTTETKRRWQLTMDSNPFWQEARLWEEELPLACDNGYWMDMGTAGRPKYTGKRLTREQLGMLELVADRVLQPGDRLIIEVRTI